MFFRIKDNVACTGETSEQRYCFEQLELLFGDAISYAQFLVGDESFEQLLAVWSSLCGANTTSADGGGDLRNIAS